MRKRKTSEEVFYESLVQLIKSQLITDPNFKGDINEQSWYDKNNKLHYGLFKEKAEYILEEIEKMKHLILFEDEPRKSRKGIKKEIVEFLGSRLYSEDNDFSILKFCLILYFTCCAERNLFKYFDFVAMPYGTLDKEVMEILKQADWISDRAILKIPNFTSQPDFDRALDKLEAINSKILKYSSFDLVELNQLQYSWQFYNQKAKKKGNFSCDIPTEMFIKEDNSFSLPENIYYKLTRRF